MHCERTGKSLRTLSVLKRQAGVLTPTSLLWNVQPICYVIMKYHSVWGQPAASMQKFIVTQMETFRLLMHPPNDKATIFFDLKGFGIKQMDFVNLLYLVKVLESYYPESLGTMYISNAPLIFWGFWRAVKNLLDPVVRNKIVFISTPDDTNGDVAADRMIEYCGGTVTTEFDYIDPKEGENDPQNDADVKQKLLARHRRLTDQFEVETRAWCKTGGKDAGLQEKRDILCKKLRLSQYELEPYTRGLSVYHRNGVLPAGNQGISVFDYKTSGGKLDRQILGRKTCRKSVERELRDIIQNGVKVKDAEAKTAKALQDGSWGSWQVNDNDENTKRVALASLEDAENTGNIDPSSQPSNGGAQATIVQQVGKADEVKAQLREARQDQTGDEGANTKPTENKANGVERSGSTEATNKDNSSASNTPPRKANASASSGSTDYSKEGPPDNYIQKKGLFGSLKAKISKVPA